MTFVQTDINWTTNVLAGAHKNINYDISYGQYVRITISSHFFKQHLFYFFFLNEQFIGFPNFSPPPTLKTGSFASTVLALPKEFFCHHHRSEFPIWN